MKQRYTRNQNKQRSPKHITHENPPKNQRHLVYLTTTLSLSINASPKINPNPSNEVKIKAPNNYLQITNNIHIKPKLHLTQSKIIIKLTPTPSYTTNEQPIQHRQINKIITLPNSHIPKTSVIPTPNKKSTTQHKKNNTIINSPKPHKQSTNTTSHNTHTKHKPHKTYKSKQNNNNTKTQTNTVQKSNNNNRLNKIKQSLIYVSVNKKDNTKEHLTHTNPSPRPILLSTYPPTTPIHCNVIYIYLPIHSIYLFSFT